MSRTLRRPMFRGGRVSAYGTGIASGLADGGMPNKRGLVTGPGGYAGYRDRQVITGGDLLKKTQSSSPYKYGETGLGQTGIGTLNLLKTIGAAGYDLAGVPLNKLTQFATGYNPGFSGAEFFGIEPDKTDTAYWMGIPTSTKEGWTIPSMEEEEINKDQLSFPRDVEEMGVETEVKTSPIDTSLVDKGVLEKQNTDDAELSLEEIKEALGSKKAFGRDATDMLLGFAGAKGDTVMEKFQDFAATESKKGPSRTEAIDQAAATFMLKETAQSKRDKRNIEMMKAKIDYQIDAGKDINIAEGVLAFTKGTNFSNKKLAGAIQNSTSSSTGEKHKYAGATDAAGLEAGLKSGALKSGDVVIVKEVIKIKGQPDKTLKKIIEIQTVDGKLVIKEIYRVN